MSGYYVKLGDTVRILFGTNDGGPATDADSLPVVTVYEQGTSIAYSPTVTNKATGLYEVAIVCSTGNGFEAGKEYSAGVAATVNGVTGRDGIGSFAIVALNLADIDSSIDGLETSIAAVATSIGEVPDEVLTVFREWSHDSGATFEGLWIRLESYLTGKRDRVDDEVIWYMRDGLSIAFRGIINDASGDRAASTLEDSEP